MKKMIGFAFGTILMTLPGSAFAAPPWYAFCYAEDHVSAKSYIVSTIIATNQNDFNFGAVQELKLAPKWLAFMKGKYHTGFTNIGCTGFFEYQQQAVESIQRARVRTEAQGHKFIENNWAP